VYLHRRLSPLSNSGEALQGQSATKSVFAFAVTAKSPVRTKASHTKRDERKVKHSILHCASTSVSALQTGVRCGSGCCETGCCEASDKPCFVRGKCVFILTARHLSTRRRTFSQSSLCALGILCVGSELLLGKQSIPMPLSSRRQLSRAEASALHQSKRWATTWGESRLHLRRPVTCRCAGLLPATPM